MNIPKEILDLIKWEQYPPEIKGGQTCGIPMQGSALICEDFGFKIYCNGSRSQMKNRNFCITVFELYLDEFNVVKL